MKFFCDTLEVHIEMCNILYIQRMMKTQETMQQQQQQRGPHGQQYQETSFDTDGPIPSKDR